MHTMEAVEGLKNQCSEIRKDMTIKQIEEIKDIDRYIDEVNYFTLDEAKRCRILLAKVLRLLDKLDSKKNE